MNKHFELAKELSVLYVEDDKDSREKIKEVLELFFKEVVTAEDGEEGLKKFLEGNFDIVFTDIYMPKMDGLEMIKKIKSINKNVKSIIITAYSDNYFLLEAINSQVDGFILKPIEINALKNVLEKILDSIYAQRLIEEYNDVLVKQLEKETEELALKYIKDDITGLYNRHALDEFLRSDEENKSLILIDINDFGSINLVYGYSYGDKLLKEFASFLQEIVDDKLFRIESDKFAIVTYKNKNEIFALIDKILQKLKEKEYFEIEGDKIYFNINIAVAYKSKDLLKKARLALEEIKLHKKGNINFYNSDLEVEKFQRKITLIKPKIIEAIKNDLIEPFYQPIVDNKTLQINKVEVLARIKDKDGYILPSEFIPVAEHTNLIHDITKTIIDKVFRIAKDYDFEFSINLSEEDLKENYFLEFIEYKVKEYNIDPSKIVFEVLEYISTNEQNTLYKLVELKNRGFKLSLDDFGTNKSNFEKILLLNLDFIKIDGKFIKNILEDEKSLKIVEAIKNLSDSMGVKTIAEYVENKQIFDKIKELGIDYSQGYYFSEPKNSLSEFTKGVKSD